MRKDRLVCTLCLGAMALASMGSVGWAVPSGNLPLATSNAMNGQIMLKEHKSSFSVTEEKKTRNVFWPVGWEPGQKVVVREVMKPVDPVTLFSISSILLGPPDLAVINGRRYETGQVIPAEVDGKTRRFKIVRILDGEVVMEEGGKEYPVAKKRRNPDALR